jgi:hypothetical protein
MSSNDRDKNVKNDKTTEKSEIKETIENKPKLKRRNAIANLELTDSYKEFIKYYNEFEKKE